MQRTALQHATDGAATCNGRHCNMQRAALQHAETTKRDGNSACNGQHCTMRKRQDSQFQMQQTTRWDATDSIATCNRQSRQHAMLQHGTSFCNMQRCSNLQHATRTTDRMQQTSCTTGSIATDGIATGTADMMQQTECNMQRKHATDRRGAVVPRVRARHCNTQRRGPFERAVRRSAAASKEGFSWGMKGDGGC